MHSLLNAVRMPGDCGSKRTGEQPARTAGSRIRRHNPAGFALVRSCIPRTLGGHEPQLDGAYGQNVTGALRSRLLRMKLYFLGLPQAQAAVKMLLVYSHANTGLFASMYGCMSAHQPSL